MYYSLDVEFQDCGPSKHARPQVLGRLLFFFLFHGKLLRVLETIPSSYRGHVEQVARALSFSSLAVFFLVISHRLFGRDPVHDKLRIAICACTFALYFCHRFLLSPRADAPRKLLSTTRGTNHQPEELGWFLIFIFGNI